MKTSNYITIAFFTFLFGGIFVLFLAAKIDPRGSYDQELLTKEQSLDLFSVIVANPGAHFRIKSGMVCQMSNIYGKDETASLPPYTLRNDTLFVSSFPEGTKSNNIEICCTKINSIEAKEDSRIVLEQFSGDSLLVKLGGAEFSFFASTSSGNVSFQIIADHSKVKIGDASFANLDLQLDKTEMGTWNTAIANLSGALKNTSSLSLGKISRINLEVDSSSYYHINK